MERSNCVPSLVSKIRSIDVPLKRADGSVLLPVRGVIRKDDGQQHQGEGSNTSIYDNLFGDEAYKSSDMAAKVNLNKVSDRSDDMGESEPGTNPLKKSYASVAETGTSNKKINFWILKSDTKVEGADVVIPAASVKKVQNRFTNTIYGYFLGKRLPFPIVENYVKNTCAKYGIAKTMMNAHGFFFFKFNSKEGMEKVMENGPWLIRNLPIILNIWKPSTKLVKEDIKSVPIWTKLHDVPIAAFSEDGLSMIATNVGTPRMLDSYTASMCTESWGRNSYARALIEVNAEEEPKESVVVAIPLEDEEGFSKNLVKIEYEWQPPRCNGCKVFGHTDAKCPKQVTKQVKDDGNKLEDGYEVVKRNIKRNRDSLQRSKVCAIIESHVDISNLSSVCKKVWRSWEWTSNGNVCQKGTRIILGWNANEVDVMVLAQSSQVIHVQIQFKRDKKTLFCSFIYAIYADNYYKTRRDLWENLRYHTAFVHDKPWVLLGDFNSSLNLEDNLFGSSKVNTGMRDFRDCIDDVEVFDVNSTGVHYTWKQKPKNGTGVIKKIDRIMANVHFTDMFPAACAYFHPNRISDHTPCILKIPSLSKEKPKPFKFANFIANNKEFVEVVTNKWNEEVVGCHMFRLTSKLKSLQVPLRKLLRDQGNLHKKVDNLRKELDKIQIQLDSDPNNEELRVKEAVTYKDFMEASVDEECFLKQKAKVQWLGAGDSNTAFFHNSIKSKNHRSRIEIVKDVNGTLHEGIDAAKALLDHYENFLGRKDNNLVNPSPELFVNKLNPDKAQLMVREVSNEEIKNAMFDIGDNKASGPDGFSSVFFKKAWDTVGSDVCLVLVHLCLIKQGLHELVSINQSAFIPGRRISDNIMLTQELMLNYHRNTGPPRCAFKIDIQKAYDTVDWSFLRRIITGFGFHDRMVTWIMKCISSTTFSLSLNGNLHGFFKGERGLRQGDPMSPYLFTLVMEVLTLRLDHMVATSLNFRSHNKCDKQRIVSLCFADDLFMFARGEVKSVKLVLEALESFKNMSGLVPSIPKSTVYFANVTNQVKQRILELVSFKEGCLPVKYLGVPLISSRLLYKDCQILVEKMENKITYWGNKFLSFAGKLQLIRSVLSSMHVYWASVFILPKRIIKELERKMKDFLWRSGSVGKGKAKVAWKTICRPRDEGGLGIKCVDDVNKALMTFHVWSLLTNRESLWVKWIHTYKLKQRCFWDVPVKQGNSWGWRKILKLRPLIREHMWSKIGDGMATYAWYDKWSHADPIGSFITPRMIQ
ncbi:uncharacterized protein LOC110914438 [Helianthus annuus]|uniref:uncharacterized protein LOC110914438 n=1 Tax=Helianthus annuus TaxID=4232 RepID=UPI000B90426D|nr:uncharacterized protein LOC110914438 [Helianthus annuus]